MYSALSEFYICLKILMVIRTKINNFDVIAFSSRVLYSARNRINSPRPVDINKPLF